jgi:hypothetical protein
MNPPTGTGSADLEPVKRQSSKPTIKATSKLNPQTGVVSNVSSMFSAEKWGKATESYFTSIGNLMEGSLEEILELTKPFMSQLKKRQESSHAGLHSLDEEGANCRARLVDAWHVFLSLILNLLITSSDIAFSPLRAG